jgi:hypothetical protein
MKFKIFVTSHFFGLHFLEPKTITFWSLFLHFTNHCFLELWRNDFLTLHAKVVFRKVGPCLGHLRNIDYLSCVMCLLLVQVFIVNRLLFFFFFFCCNHLQNYWSKQGRWYAPLSSLYYLDVYGPCPQNRSLFYLPWLFWFQVFLWNLVKSQQFKNDNFILIVNTGLDNLKFLQHFSFILN